MSIKIYTDGGNSAKNKVGGIAAVITKDDELLTIISEGYDSDPTNNMMELGAVIAGLEYMLNHPELGKTVEIVSDSEYVVLGASERLDKWKAKNWKCSTGPVKNLPLWKCIDEAKLLLNITWTWVRGHAGNKFNELADQAAVNSYKTILDARKSV